MAKKGQADLKKMIKNIKSLERTPKDADNKYFDDLQDRIMDKISPMIECEEVQESLVDFIENSLDKEKVSDIKKHIEHCVSCKKNFELTKKLVENTEQMRTAAPDSSYFEALPGRIEQRLFEEGIQTPCEKARLYIADKLFEEELPSDVEKHLIECEECARETIFVQKLMENLKELYIPTPSQKYFEEMLENVDRKIEALPSHRIVPEFQKVSIRYLADIFDTLRAALMHPYVAVALSAMVTLIVVGGKFFYGPESIEEKQINLSDVIGSTRAVEDDNSLTGSGINVYSTAYKDAISDPSEDERLQIDTTGTAKKEDERSKDKKLN